ncbi:MAG: PD40 domain-containing protein [Acidimicrobiia bacterium]|nr:PD40 domain-containing protein [Acidimicrobiia bacterium]
MNADGAGQVRLTVHAAADTLPAWSPDGGRIAFTSMRSGDGDIYVMSANGGAVTRLTTHANRTSSRHGRRTAAGSPSPPVATVVPTTRST